MQIPNIFTSFSPKYFLTIFLVKSKLSTAKKSKTTTFSRVFHPQKIDNFLGQSKLNFWTKKWRFRTVCYSNVICILNGLKVNECDISPRLEKSLTSFTYMRSMEAEKIPRWSLETHHLPLRGSILRTSAAPLLLLSRWGRHVCHLILGEQNAIQSVESSRSKREVPGLL